MKNKKNFIHTLPLVGLLLLFASISYAQRKTLWMDGGGLASESWNNMKNSMTVLGYDFEDRIHPNYGPALVGGVQSGADYISDRISADVNVLGIAHDYGGLILRQAQLQAPQITAMILNGVPNHGSQGLSNGREADPGLESNLQEILLDIKQFQDIDDCEYCTLSQSFERWVNEIRDAGAYIDEMLPNSDVIENLNDPANLPTVPFVILWGEVENSNLSGMMSSRAFPLSGSNGGDPIGDRCNEKFEAEKSAIKGDRNKAIWGAIGGFLGSTFKGVGKILKDDPFGGIGEIISGATSEVTGLVSELKDLNERQERLARCKAADDILQLEWFGLLAQLEEVEVSIPDPDCDAVDDCITQCGVDMAWGDWEFNIGCEEYCAQFIDECDDILVTVFQTEPTDGLLTRTEQILEGGAVAPYHLPNTNHFAEQVNTVTVQAMNDIFNGGAGAAFIVPK